MTSMWAQMRTDDPHHRVFTDEATGLLEPFNEHGILLPADIHVARRICAAVGETDEEMILLVGLIVRSLRNGSVCLDLDTLPRGDDASAKDWDLPGRAWPRVDWAQRLRRSSLTTHSPAPIRFFDDEPPAEGERELVYLAQYRAEEIRVHEDLRARYEDSAHQAPADLEHSLEEYFPGDTMHIDQRLAAQHAATSGLTIITGGPGTGKTTTVARLLGVLFNSEGGEDLRVVLAAPTGKAAARMIEAVHGEAEGEGFPDAHARRITEVSATTLHRLLRYSPYQGYRHNRENPLPHDVIIIDETSMVALPLMARLLDATPAHTKLIFVGDPDQLASVEVGAVFGDLVAGFRELDRSPVRHLSKSFRFNEQIKNLAHETNEGRGEEVADQLAAAGPRDECAMLSAESLLTRMLPIAKSLFEVASRGDAQTALDLLGEQQLLCAHRSGPAGSSTWNSRVTTALAASLGRALGDWYPGQPVLMTRNDHALRLYNGDSGVVIEEAGRLVAAFATGEGIRRVPLSQLSEIEPAYAITVHRSQGSQYRRVFVLLPEERSRVLTRELFYTAITRARDEVRVIAPREIIVQTVSREVERASGLGYRINSALADREKGTGR